MLSTLARIRYKRDTILRSPLGGSAVEWQDTGSLDEGSRRCHFITYFTSAGRCSLFVFFITYAHLYLPRNCLRPKRYEQAWDLEVII